MPGCGPKQSLWSMPLIPPPLPKTVTCCGKCCLLCCSFFPCKFLVVEVGFTLGPSGGICFTCLLCLSGISPTPWLHARRRQPWQLAARWYSSLLKIRRTLRWLSVTYVSGLEYFRVLTWSAFWKNRCTVVQKKFQIENHSCGLLALLVRKGWCFFFVWSGRTTSHKGCLTCGYTVCLLLFLMLLHFLLVCFPESQADPRCKEFQNHKE